jgi:hypothetical protein
VSGKSGSRKTPNPGWFSKGSSGNSGGRPTRSPAPKSSAFDVLVEKTVTVADRSGRRKKVSENFRKMCGTSHKFHAGRRNLEFFDFPFAHLEKLFET